MANPTELTRMDKYDEETAWLNVKPEDMWLLDKLILSRKLGYSCGPVGVDVPSPDWYIVRPALNALGMSRGAEIKWIEDITDHLPLGFFWCEIFGGRHRSADYVYGTQTLCVEGFKPSDELYRFSKWVKITDKIPYPRVLGKIFPYVNCEFIGNRLIDVHFRLNPDFANGETELFPVWNDVENLEDARPKLAGEWEFIKAEDYLRKGFWSKK